MRVLSLHPAATEFVRLLGVRARLVGVSSWGDRTSDAALAEVDPTDPARWDAAAVASLQPDVILWHTLLADRPPQHVLEVAAARGAPRLVTLRAQAVEGMLDDCLVVADALEARAAGVRAVTLMRERMDRALEHANAFVDGPRTVVLTWLDPLHVAGLWIPHLVERAGGQHPLEATRPMPGHGAAAGPMRAQREAGGGRAITPVELASCEPHTIIVSLCGLSLEESVARLAAVSRLAWWRALPAVRAGRVAVVDGRRTLQIPGPGLVEAQRWLVGWLQELPHLMPPEIAWTTIPAG